MAGLAKIRPCLWYDGDAEVAARHYTSAFADGRITSIIRSDGLGPVPKDATMVVNFEFAGHSFTGLNGGPQFKPNEAVSFMIACDTQAEVDHLWDHFSEGGKTSMCGWLKDRWGFAWQIAPRRMLEILETGEPEGRKRAFAAMMTMTKFDIAAIERAYAGG